MGSDWESRPLESIASFSQGFQAPTEDQFFVSIFFNHASNYIRYVETNTNSLLSLWAIGSSQSRAPNSASGPPSGGKTGQMDKCGRSGLRAWTEWV